MDVSKVRISIVVYLACIFLLVLGLEFGARNFIYDMSAGLGRLREESLAAAQIEPSNGRKHHVLLMGNSLLQEDVDLEELNRYIGSDWSVSRFAVSSTSYLDWFYGLRKILEEGSRPDIVVFCFEPRHIVESDVRTEIFAHFLMQKKDVLNVARDASLSRTDTTELIFSNLSNFYALRKEIRKNLLQKFIPNISDLTGLIARSEHPLPSDEKLRSMASSRIAAAKAEATVFGSSFMVLLVPPISERHVQLLEQVGSDAGALVLAPMSDRGVLPSDYLADAYHLNEQGRKKFTRALAPVLLAALEKSANNRTQGL